ncbi:hypothetical protein ASPZODRAFT_158221 [Penicilliopsis zonata CBS 506.65]|uniref:tRNA (guanine(37)-N1)-methyltransferase n=1 Tax=Penicilliopsis zonata CBS 506.65 TaxID=1073090 RepID=A0A1L9SMT2_9EURO|nr:hypothetical protein ASPZODRAFT_158221 [Penicilliopsis zonata CBS 506.65]OJJ48535.1 hypothetical protein ASPZODRAFT_158221 [Penicilliopsis zonata CBS 506.65]
MQSNPSQHEGVVTTAPPGHKAAPPSGQILTGKQEHYLKRELISRQVTSEITELSSPTALHRFGAPFKSEFGEVAPIDSDLPILRYIFVHHVRQFPFLDQAREKEFWQDKLQVFLESFANKHVSSSEDRLEETKRRKLARKCEKLVELMMVSGIPTASGYEERIQFAEMEVVDRGANEKGLLVNMPEGNAIHGWDVNVAAVRTTSVKRTVRYHQHAEFIIRVRREGQSDIYVGRRYGEFAKLHKRLRTEFPGKILPPLPRKNKSSTTSALFGFADDEDDVSVSSVSTQGDSYVTRTLAPGKHHQHHRSLSRSSIGRITSRSPRASGEMPRDTVLYREEQRVSLRAFLRTLLQNKRLAESKSMAEFLTARPVTLNEEEKVDVQRRKDMDAIRIEEQKRFYEIARQRAAELDVYMEQFRREIVESNGLTKLFAEIREKHTIQDLSPQYQKFAEWLRIEVAATIYHLFLAEDNSPELFAQAKRIHSLVPYTLLKNVIRVANPAAVMSGVLDLFLAQPFGSRSLLQRIFSMTLNDGIRAFQKSIDSVAAKVEDPVLTGKLKAFTDADEEVKNAIRAESVAEDVDLIVAILRSELLTPELTPEQIGKVFNSWVAWNNAVENVDLEMKQGAQWFAHMKQLLKLYTRQRDKAMMLSIVEEPVTLQLFRDLFTIFYEPLVRVYKSANVYSSITDFAQFADDAIGVVERAQRQDVSADPNQTVQAFIDLCARHEHNFYKFVHEVHLHDNGLFGSLMSWLEDILEFLRKGPQGGKLDMNALFQGAAAAGQIDKEAALAEINALIKWQEDRKRWHLNKTRQKMAAEGTGTESVPGSATFKGSDFGLDEADLEDLAISDEESDAEDEDEEDDDLDPIAAERRRRSKRQDQLRRTAGEPVKPEVKEVIKLGDSFGVMLRLTTAVFLLRIYTCQQPTGRRCEFFLWKSDAEAREKLVLLSNSRSEEHMTTPRRTPRGSTATGLLTPTTDRRVLHGSTTPSKSVKSATSARETMMLEDTDPAWWEDSTDDDVRSRPLQQPEFRSESSRKAPRTASLTSPGKRKASEMTSNSTPKTPSLFTPKTSTLFSPRTADSSSRYAPPPSAEVSLTPTPTKYRDVLSTESYSESSDLSRSTLSLLDKHSVVLPKAAQDEMLALLNKHDLRTRGISRGRDISRVALKKKDEEIKVLNEKIEDLKTQLDMSRTVVRELPEMFRPPVNRAMRVLDRSAFRKAIPLAAATVFKTSDISRVRKELMRGRDALIIPRLNNIQEIKEKEDGGGEILRKCVLLREDIKHDDSTTWSPNVSELVEKGTVSMRPYTLELDYNYWTYSEIIHSIIPEELLSDVPAGYAQVGHVAHLNLREQYLPFRFLIAEILNDKVPTVRTVINKTQDVGSHSEFRTFPFEFLAGDKDMNVVQHEQNCEFRFDYSRVYWNTRLDTEHRRLVDKFQAGQMVGDVMAGVGPFAMPAGKKKIFVWANDLNPHGYEVMVDAAERNKVSDFVTPFNRDGREFIRSSAKELLEADQVTVEIKPKFRQRKKVKTGEDTSAPVSVPENLPPAETYVRPRIFDHYVMNLPATAIEFLDAFIGVYAGKEDLFAPHTSQLLPMVHVYCFSGHSADEMDDHIDVCQRISERIGYTITPEDKVGGSGNAEIELDLFNVRLVSPNKQMFCASFRLPKEVAFKKP